MAVGDGSPGPNFDTNLAYRLSQAQGQGGSGVSILGWLMGLIGRDVNPGATMTIQGQGLIKADGKFQCAAPKREGGLTKIWKDIKGNEALVDSLKKCHYVPSQSSTESITGGNHGLGAPSGGRGGYSVGE